MGLREDLAAIEERCTKATPGPWYAVDNTEHVGPGPHSIADYQRGGNLSRDGGVFTVSTKPQAGGWRTDSGHEDYGIAPTEAEFIAAARTDMPALVEMVRVLYEQSLCLANERVALSMNEGERRRAEATLSDVRLRFEIIWAEAKRKASGR